MRPLESMKRRMRETGLYALPGNSLADKELEVYAAGLDILYEDTLHHIRDSFFQTAEEEGLVYWEEQYGLSSREDHNLLSVQDRKHRLEKRVSAVPGTKGGLLQIAEALGIPITLAESRTSLWCMACGSPSEETAEKFAAIFREYVPAHVQVFLDLRPLSWDAADASERTWLSLEAEDLTWAEIDTWGGRILQIA